MRRSGLLWAPLRDPKAHFLLSLGSFGPALGSLGVVLALFGDLWGPFGVPLGGFGGPLGCLGEALGLLWAPFGTSWGAFWTSLGAFGVHVELFWGVNIVKKSTFWSYAFYVGKTAYFVGLGGQVGPTWHQREPK